MPRVTLAQSLRNVFPEPRSTELVEAIAFMDGFIDGGESSRSDVEYLTRYCQLLCQLAYYLEQKKSQGEFVKLCHEFVFPCQLFNPPRVGQPPMTTSCHLLELLLQTMHLGVIICTPILQSLPSILSQDITNRQQGGKSNTPIILSSDLLMQKNSIAMQHKGLRKVIGIFHYCIKNIIPSAAYLIFNLQTYQPGFADQMKSQYHTLRALGCWLGAAYSPMPDLMGVKNLSECRSILDQMRQSQLPMMRLGETLSVSASFELDLRKGQFFLQDGSDQIAQGFLQHALTMPNARTNHPLLQNLSTTTASKDGSSTSTSSNDCIWTLAEIEEQFNVRHKFFLDVNALLGDDPTNGMNGRPNVFMTGGGLVSPTSH